LQSEQRLINNSMESEKLTQPRGVFGFIEWQQDPSRRTHFHNSEAYRHADDPPIARNSSVNSGVTTSIMKANRYLIEVDAFSQAHR